ncbi:pilus assembly protein TadG-related protein [Pseudokineococcus marinus]|uniref:Pilus assembly protein n=1 Tax=Pseudokineococcus marinus TaxID=351215 RepID=A0A849BMF5_9ACTN|nr:pilus assembly protein TadG-related protein [Pseudokineococcus marinus]NNH24380.1 pilus assembly protein [Pseudokineococcus marinus]
MPRRAPAPPTRRRPAAALRRRLAALRASGERGAATTFLVHAAPLLLLLGGLVHDGGQAINARAAAADDAEQAARAGADAVDVPVLRATGVVVLDPGRAAAAAAAWCAQRGYGGGDCSVSAGPDGVVVTTRARVPSAVLSLVGVGAFDVEATASARAATGIAVEGS